MEDNIKINNFNNSDFETIYLNSIESDCYPGQRRPKFKSNERIKVNAYDIYSEKDLFSKYNNNEQDISIINNTRNNKNLWQKRKSSNYKIKINLRKKIKNSKIGRDISNNRYKKENHSNKSQINDVKYINSIINNKKVFQIKESMLKNTNNNLYNNKSYSKSTYEFSTSIKDYNKSNLDKNNEQKIKISPNQKTKLFPIKNNKTFLRKISINTVNSNNSNKEYIISSYIGSNKKNSYIKNLGQSKDNSIINKSKDEKKPYKSIYDKNPKKERNNKFINCTEYLDNKTKTFFSNKKLKKDNINKNPKKNIIINSFNDSIEESNVSPDEKNIKGYSNKKGPLSFEVKFKSYKKLSNKVKSINKKNFVRSMIISKEELIKN